MLTIGVLALQGAFVEHQQRLTQLGVAAPLVRLPAQLAGLDGLILPGGESTTIGKLAVSFGLLEPLRRFGETRAMWGTCAGAILLSKDAQRAQPLLGLMDIVVARNAFGRQVDSFEVDLAVEGGLPGANGARETPFRAVFIRAPLIERVSGTAAVLARLPDGRIVAARQGRLLATAFHPELTPDLRFHQLFVEMATSRSDP